MTLLVFFPISLAVAVAGLAIYGTLTSTIAPEAHIVGKALWWYGAVMILCGMVAGVCVLAWGMYLLLPER